MGFVYELKRRNVIRVALFYIIAAWVVIQVAETVLPMFEVPDGVLRGLVVVLVIGFIPAVVFAWVFELTPEGLKLDRDAQSDRRDHEHARTKLNVATLIVALLAVAIVIADHFIQPAPSPRSAEIQSTESPDSEKKRSDRVSIAVLPFVNMSPDPDNEFFADGISEEILNLLSRVPQLQVVGRTSSFQFKGRDEDLRTIGDQLGVSHLLEGSVRKAEDQVRITAQLVSAADGVRLWSGSWNRELDNVFQLQDEIGREVTAALREELTGDIASPAPLQRTAPDAYSLYLQGRSRLAERGADNMQQAVELLRQSLSIDPDYAPAHAVLAQTLALLPLYDFSDPGAESGWIEEAVESARTALDLDPDSAMAWSALGTARAHHQWDWERAGRAFDRALELEPANAEILNLAGDFYRIIRNVDRAIFLESEALRLDPLRAFNHSDLAHAHHYAGNCERALELARSANELDPALPYGHLVMVLCFAELGRIEAMREAVQQARQALAPEIFDFLMLDFQLALSEGRTDGAKAIVTELARTPDQPGRSPARIGYSFLQVGESAGAQTWLERAYIERDWPLVIAEPIDFNVIAADPLARSILEHPELEALYALRQSQKPAELGNGDQPE